MKLWMVAVEWQDDRGKKWAVRKDAYTDTPMEAMVIVLTGAPEQVQAGVYKVWAIEEETYRRNGGRIDG